MIREGIAMHRNAINITNVNMVHFVKNNQFHIFKNISFDITYKY